MSERKLSVMDRLKAIRERMAAPTGEAVDDGDLPAGAPVPEVSDKSAESLSVPEETAPAPGAAELPDAARPVDARPVDASPGADGGSDAARTGGAIHMWDMVIEGDEDAPLPLPEIDLGAPVAPAPAPAPAAEAAEAAKPARRSGRVKTRLLGFEHSDGQTVDVFQKDVGGKAADRRFPVGWLVIVKGPGRGEAVSLQAGVSQIGRDEDQAVQLDFGDTSISRTNHAALAFDEEDRQFYIGHGGKSNIVRLNGKPLLSTEAIGNGALIRIGETTLRLVALCGKDFNWSDDDGGPKTENS